MDQINIYTKAALIVYRNGPYLRANITYQHLLRQFHHDWGEIAWNIFRAWSLFSRPLLLCISRTMLCFPLSCNCDFYSHPSLSFNFFFHLFLSYISVLLSKIAHLFHSISHSNSVRNNSRNGTPSRDTNVRSFLFFLYPSIYWALFYLYWFSFGDYVVFAMATSDGLLLEITLFLQWVQVALRFPAVVLVKFVIAKAEPPKKCLNNTG